MADTLVMAGYAGQDVHPFFKPRQSLIPGPQELLDSEEPVRKRQRTHSPRDQPAVVSRWEEERNKQTGKESVLNDTRHILEQENEIKSDDGFIRAGSAVETSIAADQGSETLKDADIEGSMPRTPPQKMLKIRSNGKLASPKAPIEQLGIQIAETSQDVDASQKRASKGLNRNFKISTNGTLDSLSAEIPSELPKRRGRKKKLVTETIAKQNCIAVLKYPVVDGIEASVGRQVDEILSGKRKISYPKPNSSSQTAKSTHPFFTGELARKPKPQIEPAGGNQAPIIDSADSRPQQSVVSKTYSGPRESRITSKPPGAGQQLNEIYDGSLPTFGTDHTKITRFPGAIEPSWPPCEMVHVGYSPADIGDKNAREARRRLERGRKLKGAEVQILPEESILNNVTKLVKLYDNHNSSTQKTSTLSTSSFRRPYRKIMTGTQLQQAILSRVSPSILNALDNEDSMEDELSSSRLPSGPPHKSLLKLMHRLPNSRSAFDKFGCETEEWVHKYSPKCAEHVLQQRGEAEVLRDWLKALTVSSIGGGGDGCQTRDLSLMSKRGAMQSGRKKKRKPGELDDFVVSSDDEPDEMTEIPNSQDSGLSNSHDKKSVMRAGLARDGERTANALIISGPHGCGKTAAVIAVAKELDFEIFEVNAGSRRSGKDILDKVGDMTRNHLVQHRPDTAVTGLVDPTSDSLQVDEKLQADLESGRQGTMQTFFKVQTAKKQNMSKARGNSGKLEAKEGDSKREVLQEVLSKPRDQKQSLILLEEVDVLFEEDKLFWATVLDLLSRSKRPVIMTCSDEDLVPLDDMALHAILRFTAPPTDLATDYLVLVAANEGHLLSRDSVQSLYEAKCSDLRASLVELNFFCQMGIGDRKGGLEWMLLEKIENTSDNTEPLRVISVDTYSSGMGWLGGEDPSSRKFSNFDEIVELSAEIWDGWHLDLADTNLLELIGGPQNSRKSRKEVWHSLRSLDQSCEAFSAADIMPASLVRDELSMKIDTSQPSLNDSTWFNYIEGPRLLQADPLTDHSGISDSLVFALRASAVTTGKGTDCFSISVQQVNQTIPVSRRASRKLEMTLPNLMSIFQPIADDSSLTPAISRNVSSSSFDSPISTILLDLAPYIRGIVFYDLQLEEQRRQLSKILTQSGRGNKKARTTRASRAALEGGNKADIRRERWFPKHTHFDSVLATGGKDWQKAALRLSSEDFENPSMDGPGSKRSSIASGAGTDD